ncbi:MAG TPA: DinB family protein [Steroidobacteraceae bacterium]
MTLLDQYVQLRRHTEALVAPLNPEDMAVQSMPDASPVKWHLAHTTWFFETFLLSASLSGYRAKLIKLAVRTSRPPMHNNGLAKLLI